MTISECGTHDWRPDPAPQASIEAWRCANCEATSATCIQGGHAADSTLPLCLACQKRTTRIIDQLDQYLRIALVADVAKSDMRSPMDYRLRVAGSKMQHEAEGAEGVLEVMLGWQGMWVDAAGSEGQEGWAEYLKGHLLWAAVNPTASAWEDFAIEIRSHRATARELAGLGPKRLPERCIHCNGDLVQDRCDERGEPYADGLQDEVRCIVCGRTWDDRGAYQLVTRRHVAESSGTVTIEQARAIWPDVPAATWRDWKRREKIVGDRLQLDDIRALVTRREDGSRVGRPMG